MDYKLIELLENNRLGEYIGIFERHKISDIDTLSELTDADLEKIGIDALGDRKRILRLSSSRAPARSQSTDSEHDNTPREVIVHHAVQSGDDIKTGFGKGFGETIGENAGGCAWTMGFLVVLVIIIAVVAQGC
jgi:hypothetical protein